MSLDEINADDFQIDDVESNSAIYTAFVDKATLEPLDRDSLKNKRGFSDAVIDNLKFRSCQPSNKAIIEQLKATYGEDALLEAGLLEVSPKGQIQPCFQLTNPNILIPYFNESKKIYYIRPHKFGLKDKGISIYCPVYPSELQSKEAKKTWVIAESEFKAAACVQFGFPAIGLPGIHSFAVNNLSRLIDWLKSYVAEIETIIILFDNEIKNDAKFSNYKPDVLKQWDTQWRSTQIALELHKALKVKVLIGQLPDEWMVDGKIDIDGALAQKRSKEEFKSVILTAKNTKDYVKGLPQVAQQIIKKKLQRLVFNSPVIKQENSYFYKKPLKKKHDEEEDSDSEDFVLKKISNFVMEIKKTVIDGNKHIREVIFTGEDGSKSDVQTCLPETISLRDYQRWVTSCGDYVFNGNQEELNYIFALEFMNCDGRKIKRPQEIGYLKKEEPPLWLLGNCVLKDDGSLLLPDDTTEGVIWDGLNGYQPTSIKSDSSSKKPASAKIPFASLDNKVGLPELWEMVENIKDIYNTKSVYLAVGWIISSFYSEEIFKRFASFPILFIGGRRESGKTTLGNWLMAMAGFADASGDSLGSASEAGVNRALAWFNSLPYWLDEYRNDSKITSKWDGYFRNVYQRQNVTKGTLTNKIKAHEINSTVMLSGEETPQDNALLSRCLVIQLSKATSKRDALNYNNIEKLRQEKILSRLLVESVKLRNELIPAVFADIDGMKERLIKQGVGERIALNYAIPAAFFHSVFLADKPVDQIKDFIGFVVQSAVENEKNKESEHMLNVFMEDLITLQEEIKDFYQVYRCPNAPKGKRRIAIHFKTFYSKWVDFFRRKGNTQFKAGTIQEYIEEEKYFIEKAKLIRIGPKKKSTRCLVLSLDPEDSPPAGLLTLADSHEGVEVINEDDTVAIATTVEELPF